MVWYTKTAVNSSLPASCQFPLWRRNGPTDPRQLAKARESAIHLVWPSPSSMLRTPVALYAPRRAIAGEKSVLTKHCSRGRKAKCKLVMSTG